LIIFTTAENTMNKKLITLAVAAAVAAPAAAMAEATLYGRLGVSLDYEDVKNAISPEYLTETVVIEPGTPIGVDADGNVVYDVNDPRIQETGVRIDQFGRPIPTGELGVPCTRNPLSGGHADPRLSFSTMPSR
jgi:hypothetical protein